ncbi:unnamed protein product, partial [Allacma fusca]
TKLILQVPYRIIASVQSFPKLNNVDNVASNSPEVCWNNKTIQDLADLSSIISPPITIWNEAFDGVDSGFGTIQKILESSQIKGTDDIIQFIELLSNLALAEGPRDQQSEILLGTQLATQVLKEAHVRAGVNTALEIIPHLNEDLRGIRKFLEGPEGRPLFEAFLEIVQPLTITGARFFIEFGQVIEDTQRSFQLPLTTFKEKLKNPEMQLVFEKLLLLPEISHIRDAAQIYVRNLGKSLQ